MTKYLMAALVVAVASTVLALSFPAEAQLQETATAAIDPRIALEIERDGKVKVLISLRDLDELVAVPVAEWTRELALGIDFDLRARHAQEVQNNVWSVLGSEDATQISGFKTMPGLAATITAPGLEKLRNHPDVVSIGAAELGSLSLSESGALVSAGVAHAAGYDGSGVTIAVLDSGIEADHPDLSDSIVGELCFPMHTLCGPLLSHPAEDVDGHGTRVSGDITSNGTVAPKGIAPEAGIFAYRITNPSTPNANAVAAALEDIRLRGYQEDFVSMSFQLTDPLPGNCNTMFDMIEAELALLRLSGDVLPFAASSNNGDKNGMTFPACNVWAVSVGAVYDQAVGAFTWGGVCTDQTTAPDLVACWSNSSGELNLLAPGCRITTTQLGGGTATVCGTSHATPIAVAVAALLKDAQPSLTANQILVRMAATGSWVFDSAASKWTPRIDARVATLTNDDADFDGDGCRNGAEYTLNVPVGGVRNPLDSEDYYDVSIPKDGVIDLANDILGVINHFAPGGDPPYDVNFDRGVTFQNGPNFWNHGPRDGVIDLPNDITSVVNQFNPGGC